MNWKKFIMVFFIAGFLSATLFCQTDNEISNLEKQLERFKNENNLTEQAKTHTKLGQLYWGSGAGEKAVENFEQAIKLNEQLGNLNAVRTLNADIGVIYLENNQFEKSIVYLKKSLSINRKLNKKTEIAADLINISTACQALEKYDESVRYADEALQTAKELNDLQMMKSCYLLLAENYNKTGNQAKSYEYQEQANTILKHLKNQELKELKIQKQQAEVSADIKDKQLRQTVDTLNQVIEINKEHQLQIQLLSKEKELQEMVLKEEQAKMRELKEKERNRRLVIIFLSVGLILVIGFSVLVIIQFREKQKAFKMLEESNEEIKRQKVEIEKQNEIVTSQNQKITDSIQYAKRIQTAVLPPRYVIEKYLDEHFIFFRPRDIVSGDFYWFSQKENCLIIAAADCTGHGVPGAFMSMLGIAYLNEIVNKIVINKHISSLQANEILNELKVNVIESLHQTGKLDEMKDGMDIAIVIIDYENENLQFSGAQSGILVVRNGQYTMYDGDNMPIGIHKNEDVSFKNYLVGIEKGDAVYLFSDGYHDQFGGPNGMKFMSRRFKEMLAKNSNLPMEEQKKMLEKTLDEWKGKRDQIDDMLVIGFRYNGQKKFTIQDKTDNWKDKMILVAEDKEMNFLLIAEALKQTKVNLRRVADGRQAVEFCLSEKPDLILMDLNMPVMDGYEATRKIKLMDPKIPIIAQTALGMEGEEKKCLEWGFDDYIAKPIILRNFLDKIESLLFHKSG